MSISREEAEKVVAGLSKAQRRNLLREWPTRIVTADWRTWPAMARKGLVRSRIEAGSIELLPLGLACRNLLSERDQ